MRLVTMVTTLDETEVTFEVIDGDQDIGDFGNGCGVWSTSVSFGDDDDHQWGGRAFREARRAQEDCALAVRNAKTDAEVDAVRYYFEPQFYECEECSAKSGTPVLCDRCYCARKDAGWAWRGPRHRAHVPPGIATAWERAPEAQKRCR
mgnify:FL=1